ncbi:uncharacterized protein EDB93DRAFT_1135899 [Suillus bovinus]|uniref:uncharacterized protein n=1 Tax=Suillus bovinus TaxID=48563 RepID=UPI001B875F75|nr:uncharacterized protein EDB93DRAFT_1135899 [Suillus bovinus]KAG2152999.1 hypothetical protein EDB93DRAFT_1135899 [Suillus bovinus]
MMFAFTTLLFAISSLTTLALSLPLNLRDVVDPPITSPTADTVWHVGEKQLVTWSIDGLSSNVTNPVGMLVLGYMYNDSENLMLNSPLATNINYTVGQALITVPNVETREDYIVVLFGDSGNASPEFTIINDSSSSSAPAPSTSSSVPLSVPTSSASPTAESVSETPTSTPVNLTPTIGTSTSTLSSGTTSVVTSTVAAAQTALTGAAWRNHASGGSIILALVSLLYIL